MEYARDQEKWAQLRKQQSGVKLDLRGANLEEAHLIGDFSDVNRERGIIVASDADISIRSFSDISDAIGVCIGAQGLILTEDDLAPEFFDLRTGLAGELFQKFTNYKLRVAIVLADPEAYGERFSELAYEHRSHSLIRFVRSRDEAQDWLLTS